MRHYGHVPRRETLPKFLGATTTHLFVAAEVEPIVLLLKKDLDTDDHVPQQVIRGSQGWGWRAGAKETEVAAG